MSLGRRAVVRFATAPFASTMRFVLVAVIMGSLGCGSPKRPAPEVTKRQTVDLSNDVMPGVWPTPPPEGWPVRIGPGIEQPVPLGSTPALKVSEKEAQGHRVVDNFHGFIVEAIVDKQGCLQRITTLRAPRIEPPWPELEDRMREELSHWKYRPATRGGQSIPVYLTITVPIEKI